jgi:MoaA/NifB/PqqE/SkfB family radical SAM enzyme
MSLSRPYTALARNFLVDVWSVRRGSRRFLPLMTNLYVTKRCNLRCRYCYPPGPEPELPVDATVALLEKIRPRNPALNLTGGEPLLYRGIKDLIRRARELDFRPLLLSTNGLLIRRVIDELHLLDHVVISLDSMQREVNETMTCVPGSTEKILEAVHRCAELSRSHGFALSLHAVIAPETIGGIEGILDLCEEIGATLSVSPEHGQFYPHEGLPGNAEYVGLIDRLIELKRRGKPLTCSAGYLRSIRDFTGHGCHPFVSPRVEPDGRVYLPCQRMPRRAVYLQDYPSLYELMRQEGERISEPDCVRRCFLACYVEVDAYLKNPFAAVEEMWMRRALLGKRSAAQRRKRQPKTSCGVVT